MTIVYLDKIEDADRIRRQIPDYLLELSQYAQAKDRGSILDYPYLDHYWREPDRFPYIITNESIDCGFALVRKVISGDSTPDFHTIAEFYIQPKSRTAGLGYSAVGDILKLFPGTWLVQVMENNQTALRFWQRTLQAYTSHNLSPQLNNGFFEYYFTY